MLVKVILSESDNVPVVIELELDELKLVYDGLNFVNPALATKIAVRVSGNGQLPIPFIGDTTTVAFGDYYGIKVCEVTTMDKTLEGLFSAVQIPGIFHEPCTEIQTADVMDDLVLVPDLLNNEPSWIPEMPDNSANNPISSGDWVGVNTVGQFTAGATILRGQPLMMVGDQVIGANSTLDTTILGFASRDAMAGQVLTVLNGTDSLSNWSALTGSSTLVVGSLYYVNDFGGLTNVPDGNRVVGQATSENSLLFTAPQVSNTSTGPSYIYMMNNSSHTFVVGELVASTPTGIVPAFPTEQLKNVVGLVAIGGSPGTSIAIQPSGVLVVPDLPSVIDDLFVPGDNLYLSLVNPGLMSVNPDIENDGLGRYLVKIGSVVSTSQVRIDIQDSVEL